MQGSKHETGRAGYIWHGNYDAYLLTSFSQTFHSLHCAAESVHVTRPNNAPRKLQNTPLLNVECKENGHQTLEKDREEWP